MALLMDLTFAAAFLNLILLAALLYPSTRNFSRTKSFIAAGLMLFILLFLVENIAAVYFHLTMMSLYSVAVQFQAMILRVIQTISFATLLLITYK